MHIDYDKLNEQAQILYNEAFQRGQSAGRDAHAAEEANYRRKANLDLAAAMLTSTISLYDRRSDATEFYDCERLAVYTRMLLARTPLCDPVDRALSLLKSATHRHDWPDVVQLKEALVIVDRGLEDLGGY